MPSPVWEPGKSAYKEWRKTLTPEQTEAHLIQRAKKKSMKKAFEAIVHAQQEEWIARINKGMIAVLQKAIDTGDANAMATVFDRVIGKPAETIQTDDNRILPWNEGDDATQQPTTDSK